MNYRIGLVIFLILAIIAIVFITSLSERPATTLNSASTALIQYFDFLNAKNYDAALAYHGSGFELLQTWNPDIDPNDHIDLLRHGCESNGWNCVRVKQIVSEERVPPDSYRFQVQFQNNDGTLFKRGPCCGSTEAEMPTQTTFEYIVKKEGEKFVVMTEPVYTP